VKGVENFRDAWHRRLGQQLLGVRLRIPAAQRVPLRDRRRPVEHFFPVGFVAGRRGFEQYTRVAGLAVGAVGDEFLLFFGGFREKLGQHSVGRVEQIFGQVVARVDEACLETATNALDHRFARRRRTPFESKQVNVENVVAHAYYAIARLGAIGRQSNQARSAQQILIVAQKLRPNPPSTIPFGFI